jgi:hypothetical protein
VFTYDIKTNIFFKPPESFLIPYATSDKEKYNLDFGDFFTLKHILETSELTKAIEAIGYNNNDTIYSMICFYVLSTLANTYAIDWWEGSYASILYPNAKLEI